MNTKKLLGTILGVVLFGALIAGATFAWLTGDVTVVNQESFSSQITDFIVSYSKGNDIGSSLPIIDSTKAMPGTVAKTNGGNLTGVEAAVTAITIKRASDATTIPDGHASIWLKTTTTNSLSNDEVVRWAICRVEGEVTEDSSCGGLTTSFEESYYTDYPTNTQINESSPILNMGTVDVAANGAVIPLLSDARLAETPGKRGNDLVGKFTPSDATKECTTTGSGNSEISMCPGTSSTTKMLDPDGTTYFIYFWLDGENITNNHLKEQYPGGVIDPDLEEDELAPLYRGFVFASATQLQN